jgi:Mg-chelatase subunit ChlD
MKKITYLLIFICNYSFSQCANVDVVIAVDYSGSTKFNRLQIKESLNSFVNQANDFVNIGIVYFTENTYIISEITNDKNSLIDKIDDDYILSNGTDIGKSLELSRSILSKRNNDNKKIIIIISDGDPNGDYYKDYSYLKIAEYIKNEDIIIYSLYVKSVYNTFNCKYKMQKISSSGFFTEIENYHFLKEEIKSIVLCM